MSATSEATSSLASTVYEYVELPSVSDHVSPVFGSPLNEMSAAVHWSGPSVNVSVEVFRVPSVMLPVAVRVAVPLTTAEPVTLSLVVDPTTSKPTLNGRPLGSAIERAAPVTWTV